LPVRAAFPDWRVEITDMIAKSDMVVIRWQGQVIHQGNFYGIFLIRQFALCMYALPIALANLTGEHVQDTELMMAGAVITILPVMIVRLPATGCFVISRRLRASSMCARN
jgi:SnoaL-like polyketide cyclase